MLHCPTCGRRYPLDVLTCPQDGTPLKADATIAAVSVDVQGSERKTAAENLVGTVLDGKYRLDAPIGAGGMGTVFRAMHLLIERPVAVKILNPRLVTDEAAQERLRREARAAGRLRHTNAVAVTDFGKTGEGVVYIVMELLEGVSLRELLTERGVPLEPELAVEIMLQTAAAVAAAHEAGIIHRDLKPGNVFILERPHAAPIVKVLDFGIAKVAASNEETGDGVNEVAAAMTLTETGVMIGTPRYMSPEQCDGLRLTPASDVYSLSIILYEMLAGAPPFTGATPLSVALKHSAEPPRPLREINPATAPELEAVVLHALSKRPEERPQDAAEFRRELYRVAEQLNLVQASGFSVPTATMPRDSGAAVSGNDTTNRSAPTTLENAAPVDTDAIGGRAASPAATTGGATTGGTTIVATPAVDNAAASSPAASRGDATQPASWFGEMWTRNPAALVGGGFVVLLVCGLLVASLVRSSAPEDAGPGTSTVVQNEAPPASAADSSEPQAQANQTTGQVAPRSDVLAREPQTANDFYERAGYLFEQRDYAQAESALRRAIELQPSFPEAHNRLGRALVQQGEFTAAVAEFRRAVEARGGDFAIANFNLGDALERTGDYRQAIAAYQAAIANRNGGYPEAHFEIGRIHFNRNRNAEAATSFRQAINLRGGDDPVTNYYLGVALARARDFTEAETALRTAIDQRGGTYPEAAYALGLLYENTNRYPEAVQLYETYLQQQPDAVNRRQVESALRTLRRRMQ